MIAIYVRATWLKEIGDLREALLLREYPEVQQGVVSLLAGKTQTVYPFVETEIARRDSSESGQVFLPAKIPVDVVRGIFDLTHAEEQRYGFSGGTL